MGMDESKRDIRVEDTRLVTESDVTKISADAEWFRDCFKLASALILTEVQFDIEDDGLHMKQMEESHIARTDLFLPKVLFKELKKGKIISTLRFDVRDINAILSKVSKGDVVTFSISEGVSERERGRLVVELKGRRINTYRITLFEAEELNKRDPRVVFSVRVKTNIDGIVEAVDKAKALLGGKANRKDAWTGTFTLESNPMGIAMKFAGDDGMKSGSMQLTNAWDIMQFEGKTGQQVIVAQAYIEAIIKAIARVTNMVTIEMATFIPLHIIAELPFKGSLSFWLAPRVPDEEADKVRGRAPEKEVSAR